MRPSSITDQEKQGPVFLAFIKKCAPLALLVLSSSLVYVPSANAEYEGCPETWVLNTSQSASNDGYAIYDPSLSKQLSDIQKIRGVSNMTIKAPTSYSVVTFDGELGPIDEKVLKQIPWGSLSSPFHYLYGNSIVEETFVVEVRGCSGTRSFVNRRELAQNISFTTTTAEEWVKENPVVFKDFKEEQDFLAYLNLVQEKIKREAALFSKLQNGRQVLLTSSFLFKKSPKLRLEIVPQSPNCVNNFNNRYLSIELGSLCNFAFSINDLTERRSIFETFAVDGRPVLSEITCVKGKVTKKVRAVKPACPSGYKKK
jgi:hypothetical protein